MASNAPPSPSRDLTPEKTQLLLADIDARRASYVSSSRLSLPPPQRILIGTSTALLAGFSLGLSHGMQSGGLVFRAENAHRLPRDATGWYLYHKSKNYNMALAGVKEGVRMAGRMGVWVGLFLGVEEVWDHVRGRWDFGSSVMASATVAGGFSLWNRFPIITAARTAKTGLAIGLAYGLAQDAVGALRGRRPAYVDFILGRGKRRHDGEDETDIT